jgi:hypothetical protein
MSMQEAARRQLQSKQDRAQDERPRPPMTMREVRDAERKGRPRKKKTKSERKKRERQIRQEARTQAIDRDNDHSVLSFLQWCGLNGFSPATGRRIIKADKGPPLIRLSERRIGITIGANREWQASGTRASA